MGKPSKETIAELTELRARTVSGGRAVMQITADAIKGIVEEKDAPPEHTGLKLLEERAKMLTGLTIAGGILVMIDQRIAGNGWRNPTIDDSDKVHNDFGEDMRRIDKIVRDLTMKLVKRSLGDLKDHILKSK